MHRFQWLDTHDAEIWGTVWEFVTWVPADLDEHLKSTERMALTDYLTLLSIARADDHHITMINLAHATRMSPSRLSHVMDRLEDRGLAERTRSDQDRRSSIASLAPDGVEFMVRVTPNVVKHMRETIFEAVTEAELDQLSAIMKKIMK